jgi:serine/threonine-protein kinase ATR
VADCYDVLAIHTYAEIEGWPTWERSYPEDPRQQNYLADIRRLAAWRDEHATGKEIWITEFGYDAIDLPPDPAEKWKHWRGLTALQQAQWTLRSWLVFATLPVTRAYYFFFNDYGEPKNHHASGMTRHDVRRPVFFATAHLQATLGEFRLARIVLEEPGRAIVLEFVHDRNAARSVWVVWSPTGDGRTSEFMLPRLPGRLERAERMPLGAEPVPAPLPDSSRRITLTESPLYLFLRAGKPRPKKSS